MKTPADRFEYVKEEGEVYLPNNLPTLVSDDDDDEQRQTPFACDLIQLGQIIDVEQGAARAQLARPVAHAQWVGSLCPCVHA